MDKLNMLSASSGDVPNTQHQEEMLVNPQITRAKKLREEYEMLIAEGNSNPAKQEYVLKKIRNLILMQGLPPETEEEKKNVERVCTLRGRIWQILIGVKGVSAKQYIELVSEGKCSFSEKLRHDSFRTFQGRHEPDLKRRVTEEKLIRVLEAFGRYMQKTGEDLTYAQGMNQLVSPFIYVMPEVDAFFTFCQFLRSECPLYWSEKHPIAGAYVGLELFSKILKIVDDELYYHFEKTGTNPKSTTPPMTELLKLWDFLLAFGVHLNILIIVAQILLIREELLSTEKPLIMINERAYPHLDSHQLISVAVQLLRQLPDDLYTDLANHTSKDVGVKHKFNSLPRNFSQKNKLPFFEM